MQIYTVFCTTGNYDVGALVKAKNKKAAKQYVQKRVQILAHSATSDLPPELLEDFSKEIAKLKKGKPGKVFVYSEGS